MTVDGPDERPLALRDLAHEESPELVRAALGRFRRRLFTRGLILVLIAAVALFLYPRYHHDTGDLRSEIEQSHGVTIFNTTKAGSVDSTILRVARLSRRTVAPGNAIERYGIHLVVTSVPTGPPEQMESYNQIVPLLRSDFDRGVISFRLESDNNLQNGFQMWISLIAGTPTIDIPIATIATNTGPTAQLVRSTVSTLHIDMQKLGVPDWTWR
jgi:hypothetical protein